MTRQGGGEENDFVCNIYSPAWRFSIYVYNYLHVSSFPYDGEKNPGVGPSTLRLLL